VQSALHMLCIHTIPQHSHPAATCSTSNLNQACPNAPQLQAVDNNAPLKDLLTLVFQE